MSVNPVIPAVIVGGIAYTLSQEDDYSGSYPPGYVGPNYGSTIGQIANGNAGGAWGYPSSLLDDGGQAGFGSRTSDPDATAKLDLLYQSCQGAYNKMSGAAKAAAAAKLNETLKLNPPLQGNETWEQVSRIAGGAAASAGCTAIPGVGIAIAPLCGMAGAYLGVKLEDWVVGPLDDLKNWAASNIGDLGNAIGNAVSDAAGYVANAAEDVYDWISDLF